MDKCWVRVSGTNGFCFESYGGGWQMTDTTWIRAYNGKSIYTSDGTIRSDKISGGCKDILILINHFKSVKL